MVKSDEARSLARIPSRLARLRRRGASSTTVPTTELLFVLNSDLEGGVELTHLQTHAARASESAGARGEPLAG